MKATGIVRRIDEAGRIVNTVSEEYPLEMPFEGWSQQNPADWWAAVCRGLDRLCVGVDKSRICGIGSGGQMHGLVVLDENDEIIRPAILWNDGRTTGEVEYLNETVGREKLSAYTANIAFAGFTAPKLLWMKNNEPELFKRIRKIMLPKDYITYRLTGVFATDYSDASGMLLLDVKNRRWSEEMLAICHITEDMLPALYESYQVCGKVKKEVADRFGFGPGVKVVAGAGDNAAAAVGCGTVVAGKCNLSIGTSGTVFIAADEPGTDPNNGLHAFAHANGKYHLMGCMLSAASCNKWLCESILQTGDFSAEQMAVDPDRLGENNVFFLPYLMGERSPINDTDARGAFVGMAMDTRRCDMVQAMLEGVAFALRDSVEAAKAIGCPVTESTLCGGGARSPLWRKIIANVLGISLKIPQTEEGPGYGGAMLAMVGCGRYPDVESCAEALCSTAGEISPDPELVEKYNAKYEKFRQLYPSLKNFFKN